jgi:hypothetical protein
VIERVPVVSVSLARWWRFCAYRTAAPVVPPPNAGPRTRASDRNGLTLASPTTAEKYSYWPPEAIGSG